LHCERSAVNNSLLLFGEPVVHCPAVDTFVAEISSTDTEFGVTVNITCITGYRISGQTTATVHCTSTGQWSLNATCLRTLHLV